MDSAAPLPAPLRARGMDLSGGRCGAISGTAARTTRGKPLAYKSFVIILLTIKQISKTLCPICWTNFLTYATFCAAFTSK